LHWLNPPSTVGASSSAAAIELPDAIGAQEGSLELAVGQWSVVWAGHSVSGRLALSVARSPLIALETISGRCSLRGDRCILDERAKLRSMAVGDQR
jgi:hypothetical protein